MSSQVMIVDDDAALNRLTSLVLRSDGFEVASFTSPKEALSDLARGGGQPLAIILDLAMPEMDGREFYRRLREAGYTSPVIILSAFGAAEAQRELGAEGSLAKPFEAVRLVSLLRGILAARQTPC